MLAVRSIPLSKETRDAWNSANVRFVRRNKGVDEINRIIERFGDEHLINLGNLEIDFASLKIPVWNRPDTIRGVSSPLSLRRTLGDFIPTNSITGPHWHKRGGFGGDGKVFHEDVLGVCAVTPGDVQSHIEGTEFRVISVGDLVVQAHRKELLDGIGNFDWYWTGVGGISTNGIIPHIKQAIQHVPFWETAILGWDIIVSSIHGPLVIEINTSPGVNDQTAQRIVAAIERSK